MPDSEELAREGIDALFSAAETPAEYASRKGNFLSRVQHMPP